MGQRERGAGGEKVDGAQRGGGQGRGVLGESLKGEREVEGRVRKWWQMWWWSFLTMRH